ncbi:MAG: LEA type 2 family protein [Gammaproteobacteria bacterium]|nr:LEA type 2 family protein [Gammaproteobacteria bacterium]
MLKKSYLSLSIVVVLLLSACASIQPLQEPDVTLNSLGITSMSLDEQKLRLVFDVYNPNKQSLVIKGLEYQLAVGKVRLASGRHDEVIRMPANSKQSVVVDVTTYLNDVLPLLSQLLGQADTPLDYTFEMKVKLSRPVPYTFNLSRDGVVTDLLK